ncbi:hypothetical protein DUI87_09081 [Hirundo rustica rustica]|uniref:Endonuclease/exonuclease/phosphatase domain-containing protein n=1 Tax=Hirundo rustica rustica TaxID=333673 RepID=A0A3M0L3Q6_HIRRU|nr:hypothetical protein DUI87_09081 [Hirundo rustica rustica]
MQGKSIRLLSRTYYKRPMVRTKGKKRMRRDPGGASMGKCSVVCVHCLLPDMKCPLCNVLHYGYVLKKGFIQLKYLYTNALSIDNKQEELEIMVESKSSHKRAENLWEASPSQAVILMGDFNHTDVYWVLDEPTRGEVLLDLVLTSANELIKEVTNRGSLGCSDFAILRNRDLNFSKLILGCEL